VKGLLQSEKQPTLYNFKPN